MLHDFANKVSEIPAVRIVALADSPQGVRIWTILDAEPNNRDLRDRIYDIEGEVLDRHPNLEIDFSLVNLAECPNPDLVHLPTHEVIYQR